MKKITIAAGFILLMTSVASAVPMKWDGNGNYYDVVYIGEGLTWEEANALAIKSGGHLATMTSAAENSFVWELLNDILAPNTRYASYWLGGYQSSLDVEPLGNWAWVTGEAWDYAPWHPNEPNNGVGGTQHYLHYWDTDSGEWDDMDNRQHMAGYIVEYEDYGNPIPGPEPTTMFLLGAGMIGIAGFRKKLFKA
jgi:hypothetical protein